MIVWNLQGAVTLMESLTTAHTRKPEIVTMSVTKQLV